MDDGTRVFGKISIRKKNNDRLKQLLAEQQISYISIKGNYQERLQKVIPLINKLLD
ncbi:hypothetical protein [Ornithinibacillus scapharcae]|uniref:hypothetical protein n=1 Tax=Ornithinibacillus scapharcae TaxID=1147159 RepID=UPI000225BA49|nr:hypothetical protein [Ornithinibacillus scapharcae]